MTQTTLSYTDWRKNLTNSMTLTGSNPDSAFFKSKALSLHEFKPGSGHCEAVSSRFSVNSRTHRPTHITFLTGTSLRVPHLESSLELSAELKEVQRHSPVRIFETPALLGKCLANKKPESVIVSEDATLAHPTSSRIVVKTFGL